MSTRQEWTETMDAVAKLAETHGLEFHELRNAWGHAYVTACGDLYKDHGVTSSDYNHMVYGVWNSRPEEFEAFAATLGEEKRERDAILLRVAAASGQHPTLVLQQLREFLAPPATS